MANPEHLKILKQGVEVWNKWREEQKGVEVDLGKAYLRGANLARANLAKANLAKANLGMANLMGVDLTEANLAKAVLNKATLNKATLTGAILGMAILPGANLTETNLSFANLSYANLHDAIFTRASLAKAVLINANLRGANFNEANLEGANLCEANLNNVNLEGATLINCRIHGASVWNVNLKNTTQKDLLITHQDEPAITVDNLEVAQFVYLLLNNKKIRDVIDTIGQKCVLILGRFTGERKAVLDAIRNKLRDLGFVPMMFDFERPTQRNFTETIKILAGLSRFIIADITNPKSSPLELQATMPDYMIPFVPIIHEPEQPFAMFRDLDQQSRDWVLPVLQYPSTDRLLKVFESAIVKPALKKSAALLLRKTEAVRTRHVKDYEGASES